MAWIKRNLFFLIGTLIALGLMGYGIFYLLGQINYEHQVVDSIQQQYETLKSLTKQNPHPGNEKVDNIKAARDQETILHNYIKRERAIFEPIPSIPDTSSNKISNADFNRGLRNTIADLRRSATSQSVELPNDYNFTFKAQVDKFTFEPGTLEPLASHLGEIKAICDVLFDSKINYLENIQREVISSNQDNNTPDYLTDKKTVSTPLADLTPYQITFRCFSAELAQVLANFATSPYGFFVESINVEPIANLAEENAFGGGGGAGAFAAPTAQPPFTPGGRPAGYLPGQGPGGRPGTPAGAGVAAAAPHSNTFLNEKPFRVTLLVQVIKPKTAAAAATPAITRATRPAPPTR